MLLLEGESVRRRTEWQCLLPELCQGGCSGSLSTSQACTTSPPLKIMLQKQTEEAEGQWTSPLSPFSPVSPGERIGFGRTLVWEGCRGTGHPGSRALARPGTPQTRLCSGMSHRGFTANLRPW